MLVTKQVTTLFQSNFVFHSGDDEQLNGVKTPLMNLTLSSI